MDDVWVRLGLILGAVALAGLATITLRSRAGTRRRRTIRETGLTSGTYLFTSSTCPDCTSARKALLSSIGQSGYTEVAWEKQPGLFHRFGVDAVPSTLVVDDKGDGVLVPGIP